jgi:molybdopterin-guanine dinucleotide biosynthesis protein MobB
VLAVCGFSGAGKTTLLEAAIPLLIARGLRVAVIKHDAHGFTVDKPGKDSERLFRAGATVALRSAGDQFDRRHAPEALPVTLARLGREHDLLLVEGHKLTPLPKLWLHGPDGTELPPEVSNVLVALGRDDNRLKAFLEHIEGWLPAAWSARPLHGGVMVGGMSRRMGHPKQLIKVGALTMGEIAVAALSPLGDERVVALGNGALPEWLNKLPRLADIPGIAGPAAALLAAHRWLPDAAWILTACDHPTLRPSHIEWLRGQRRPGCWAVLPRQEDGHPCPTLALYEPQALELLEAGLRSGEIADGRPAALVGLPQTACPQPPAGLAAGWRNVNTPEELAAAEARLAIEGETG